MKTLLSLFFAIIFFSSPDALADFRTSDIDLGFGVPTKVSIQNPDDSSAYYTGYGLSFRLNYSFVSGSFSSFRYGMLFEYKNLNLQNTKKSSIDENAQESAYGLGFYGKYSQLYFAVAYLFAQGKHTTSGTLSSSTEYHYNPIELNLSYLFRYGTTLEIGPSYSYTTGSLSTSETGFSKKLKYSEQMLWLRMVINFNEF